MGIVNVMGWIAIAAGAAVVLSGAWTICGTLWWHANWKWGDARAMRESVRLGWNTGAPPEGKIVLVREHASGIIGTRGAYTEDHRWALMVRRGERCHTLGGGYSTPITNITGWLATVEATP